MCALALPVVLAELGWVAMGVADTIMVGPLGPAAIGAVGLGSTLFMSLGIFGLGLLLGLDTLVARAYGARQLAECRRWLVDGLYLGVVVVVFCDNSLNRIELKQMALKYPSWGTRFESTDLVKVAEGMGCDGARAEQPAELARLLDGAASVTRPLVIEAHIDPAQYLAQF